MNRSINFVLLLLLTVMINGCAMKWSPDRENWVLDKPTRQSANLLRDAQQIFNDAQDEASLRLAVKAYGAVLEENPGDYGALKQLSTQHILLGTAYTKSRRQKSDHYLRAMLYAERAMFTNDRFRKQVMAGKKPWEAIEKLTIREVEAMFFWVTALQYEFKEGMNLPGKIANIAWLQRALIFLDRIEELAPEFGAGAVEFAMVICYYALPKSMGGSKSKGDALMQKAVLRGDGWLLPRWARGKYYYIIRGEKEKSLEDLAWVASRDPSKFEDPYPWRVHFQEDAKHLLE